MKRKLLTVLLMSAMVLAGSTVAKADDVFDSNTEETSQIDMNMENPSEANPEDTIGNLDEIADEVSDKERNTEDFITTYADGIAIDEAHFPDEGFRKYLKDNFDKNADGYFSQDEIDSITAIGMSNIGIKDLKGIELFTNLQWLHFGNNQVTNLDISKNLELKALSCRNNQLKELDISNNKKLQSFQCNGNQLTNLDISNNLEMITLDCSDNQLVNIEMAENSKLQFLWCVRNQLSSLDVSKITDLVSLRCFNNHLEDLDLSYNKKLPTRIYEQPDPHPDSWSTSGQGGAYVTQQDISANIVSTNGTWTLDLAAIVGKENLSRVTLVTDGAKLSTDGTVTFSGSTMPTELVYNYDTKNPAEDTPMTVHVALTRNNVDDQTGKDVTVDTDDLDIENICKENNISINANFEIILSQGTPSKESLDKLTQAAETNGYSISATYEILMTLFSDGQKITDIIDNFGRIKLTFQVNASLAGQNVIVYQLHNNSQVIVHDGLTINADGTVTITVDKFSSFAVAVKPSSNNTGKPDTDQPGTNKPDSNRPDTNKPDSNRPDTNKPATNQSNANQSNGGQSDVKQTNTNQLSPKTGDSTNPAFWLLVAMAASITGILNRKRFYKH